MADRREPLHPGDSNSPQGVDAMGCISQGRRCDNSTESPGEKFRLALGDREGEMGLFQDLWGA